MHQAFLSAMGGVLRFGWGDGTYKGRREWYNTRYRYLPREHVIQAARASKWLSKNPPRRFEDRDDSNHGFQPDEDEDFDELHNLRCKHSQFLFDHILLHTHVPQRLGQGHTTLVDKVSAHIHSTLLEVTSVDELVDALDSYVVWCADMGTEVGLPDFTAEHLLQALPPYLRPGVMHSDVDDGDEAHIHGYGEPRCNHARPLMQGSGSGSVPCYTQRNQGHAVRLGVLARLSEGPQNPACSDWPPKPPGAFCREGLRWHQHV